MQDDALALFARAGVIVGETELNSRKLVINSTDGRYSFVLVKPGDVPTYVEYGVADAGICGRDVLMESAADVHEPLDLKFGYCRLVLAGKADPAARGYNPLVAARVATKYPRLTSDYFQRHGVPIELIVLSGSVELAAVLGLAHHIVDLVETGRTLRDNGLVVVDTIAESTARLIVNRASYHLKRVPVMALIKLLREAVKTVTRAEITLPEPAPAGDRIP